MSFFVRGSALLPLAGRAADRVGARPRPARPLPLCLPVRRRPPAPGVREALRYHFLRTLGAEGSGGGGDRRRGPGGDPAPERRAGVRGGSGPGRPRPWARGSRAAAVRAGGRDRALCEGPGRGAGAEVPGRAVQLSAVVRGERPGPHPGAREAALTARGALWPRPGLRPPPGCEAAGRRRHAAAPVLSPA